jgi:hypothetical protein
MEICTANVHYNPSPTREGKPSTTLPYKGTEGCCGEVVVEKHVPHEVTCCTQHVAQTECAYNDLAEERGDNDVGGIIDKREATTKNDRDRVKVVETVQRTVGHQAPQELRDLVTGRDNDDGENVVQDKPPRKPPDIVLSISTVKEVTMHQEGAQRMTADGRNGTNSTVNEYGHRDVGCLVASPVG